jgi:hypothetical protein
VATVRPDPLADGAAPIADARHTSKARFRLVVCRIACLVSLHIDGRPRRRSRDRHRLKHPHASRPRFSGSQ